MSAAIQESESDTMYYCANCGVAGGDDIKLKKCTACHLVRYCGVKCQKEHWSQHKRACKKRAAELRDELLFKQPEGTHLGDCPICCLPVPIEQTKSTLNVCCSKRICNGCDHANKLREYDGRLLHKCPFCRKKLPDTQEEADVQRMKRVEANDPTAICHMGSKRNHEGDNNAAFEYWTRAADLGDAEAHYQLSNLYRDGEGVLKDEKRERHHLTVAAIGGHPVARHNLACMEGGNGQHNRAAKHFIIAAKLGYDKSLKCVKEMYKAGVVSKEDFGTVLRGYQAAIEATKSPQREEVSIFLAERKRRGI